MKDLRLVEFAVALGRHRNFARAAKSMGVTQPTFSRGIAALEKGLGAHLFDRSTRRCEPTPIGKEFLERAELLLQDAVRLGELTRSGENSLVGRLVIGSGPYPLECGVLSAAARLAARHPRLRLQIVEGAWRELPDQLLLGSVDVVVVEASLFANDHRVQVELLPSHRGCLVCRPGHPLTRLPLVSIEHLEPYPLAGITLTREFALRVGKTSRKLQIDPRSGDLTPQIVTTSLHAMRQVVLQSDAVGVDLVSRMRDEGRADSLVKLNTDFVIPSTAYGTAMLRERTPSRAAVAFAQLLREIEQEQLDAELATAVPIRSRPKARR
jgi:DNA-binding transcriptional LysR family regulator